MIGFENEIVSVIIPVYNAEKYLCKTIDSVLRQTYALIEIVITDDCSTDGSERIVNEYLKKHSNITYTRLAHNSGAAAARNQALQQAKGRYVAFLDSDDLWLPQKIEKQLHLIRTEHAAICFTAVQVIDENDCILKDKRNVLKRVDYNFLLRNTMIATSSVVVDRRQTGPFEMPPIKRGQDYATWLQLLRNGVVAFGINESLVKYRKSSNSLSSRKFDGIRQVWTIQTQYEKISPIKAAFNSLFFAVNAFKKHYL